MALLAIMWLCIVISTACPQQENLCRFKKIMSLFTRWRIHIHVTLKGFLCFLIEFFLSVLQ